MNINSLIDNRSFLLETQHDPGTRSYEDYSGSGEICKVSRNEKMYAILQKQTYEFCYENSAPKSENSINLSAVLSSAILIICTIIPFVSVDMPSAYMKINLINMQYGWLILICGVVGVLAGLKKKNSVQWFTGIGAILSFLLINYIFFDGGYSFPRSFPQRLIYKEFGFYLGVLASIYLTISSFFDEGKQK